MRAIEEILPLVTKPSRYLGNEFHAVVKDPASVQVQWLLILPEVYEIGMSHWGLKILYDVLNRRADALAERAFSPWVDMEERMRRASVPLFSLESHRPARDFDLVGFSLQYELAASNVLNCLDLAGIPIWARERKEGDPLVIGGGPCVTNPEPLAEFFDAFLIGDGEEAVGGITETIRETKGMARGAVLEALARIAGIYVPSLYEARYDADGRFLGTFPLRGATHERVARTFVTDLEDAPYPERPVVPLMEIVQDRMSIEVLRGCTQGCRFCQAGYFYRPVRERSPGRILDIAEKGLAASGWDTIGLVSLSTADYTQLDPLSEALNARFADQKVSISLPSLRADSFGVAIAERVREVKKTGFTFAPEAGSERLRRVINKQITDEEFLEAARIVYGHDWRLIKLYMMIGLPTEEWEDIESIVEFSRQILAIARQHGPSCKLNLSVGAFVPKSHTPFQWEAFEEIGSLRRKIDHLKNVLSSRSARVKWNDLEPSHIEAVLSRGDRRLSRAIYRSWELGSRFDGWSEHFSYERWLRAFEETGIDVADYTRARMIDEPLPWDHIDIGILKKFLVREREKAFAMEPTADCRRNGCVACGIPGMPNDTVLAVTLEEQIRRGMAEKPSTRPSGSGSDSSSGSGSDSGSDSGSGSGSTPAQAPGITWPMRLRFAKEGRARFLSHLETGTILERAFRIAEIRIAFSQGHTPHPKFHFGPPLPVGISGKSELCDIDLAEPWRTDMIDRLNSVLPGGFRLLDARALPAVPGMKKMSLSQEACIGRYEADLSDLSAERRETIGPLLDRYRSVPDWIIRKGFREEDARTVDLKRACLHLEWNDGDARMRMDLRLIDVEGHTANPARILGGIFGLGPEDQARCVISRTALVRVDGTPI
jgi:radical SAM family uncharacterized protein/radical SAM-linked protein